MLLRTMRLIFISWDTGGKQVRATQINSCRVWSPEKTTRKVSAVDLHYIQIMEMFRVGWKNIFVSGTFLWVFHRDDQETDFVYHWILSPNCTTLSLIFLICVQPSFITGNLVYKTPLPSPSITYFQLKCPRPTHASYPCLLGSAPRHPHHLYALFHIGTRQHVSKSFDSRRACEETVCGPMVGEAELGATGNSGPQLLADANTYCTSWNVLLPYFQDVYFIFTLPYTVLSSMLSSQTSTWGRLGWEYVP